MTKQYSSEMVSTKFSVGWLYTRQVRDYLHDLINNKNYSISFEEKLGFFENHFFIHGPQRELYSIHRHLTQWFNSFDF